MGTNVAVLPGRTFVTVGDQTFGYNRQEILELARCQIRAGASKLWDGVKQLFRPEPVGSEIWRQVTRTKPPSLGSLRCRAGLHDFGTGFSAFFYSKPAVERLMSGLASHLDSEGKLPHYESFPRLESGDRRAHDRTAP
jgi:hypothetical protein